MEVARVNSVGGNSGNNCNSGNSRNNGNDRIGPLPRKLSTGKSNVNMTLTLTRSIGHTPGNSTLMRVLSGKNAAAVPLPPRHQASSTSLTRTLTREKSSVLSTKNNVDNRDGKEAAMMPPPPPPPPPPPLPPLHQGTGSAQGEIGYSAEGDVPGNETLMRKWKQGENKTLMRNWQKDAAEQSSRFGGDGAGDDISGNRTLMRKWGAGENKTLMRNLKSDEVQSGQSSSSSSNISSSGGGDHMPGNQTLMRKWGAGAGEQTLMRKK